ncbi:hypothetical protein [Actinomadura xylanilytica]|uniref:hypothetical protein n=1 Tax=Actinomadura xylanilytica TaxID=887459 RepID=UPI00255AF3A4|nr:hypothetical protein [Actinomadura xylanilytica]MDL4777675.1 hypothetical protein [Actinomadura xylanilytica]
MTFELVVWHEPAPITAERAGAVALDEIAPYPGVAEFAEEFGKLRPEVAVTEVGSRYARVRMTADEADEVSAEVHTVARAHGLVCYDQARGLVHNLGPTGAYEGVQLHTGEGLIVVDPDLALVDDVLRRLSPANPFTTLVLFGRHFIQVSPEPGGYELEYKDSVQGRLYQTHVTDLDDVKRAFREYLADDRSFLGRHHWDEPLTG